MYRNIDDGREVTTRKQHKCEWCGGLINKGEKAIMRKYIWDDRFNNSRMHLDCYEAMLESISNAVDGEFFPYEQKRAEVI